MRNPVKTAKRQLLRAGSCALSALMVLGSIPAAAIGDGVTATYDEAYYAMTDYYGNLTDGSVVKNERGWNYGNLEVWNCFFGEESMCKN